MILRSSSLQLAYQLMCGLLNKGSQALNSLFLLSWKLSMFRFEVCFYRLHLFLKVLLLNADLSSRYPLIKLCHWCFHYHLYCSHPNALKDVLLLVDFSLILSLPSSVMELNSHSFQRSWTLHLKISIVNWLSRHQRR